MQWLGKILLITGFFILLFGALLFFAPHLPFMKYLGRLPGDIAVRRENFQFFFPVTTSIILSILLTVVFYLINLWRR